ncbi:MAG: D-alanyl-D-alanine carboxypeptidase [Geosporobacter ferrireducens]|nr:D-alanyl-D-alanine carboxypeptidase [Geosporobacter ferrireducens]
MRFANGHCCKLKKGQAVGITEGGDFMKEFILVIIIFSLPITAQVMLAALDAESVILLDQNSGEILYRQNEHKRLYPASTTKVMTALLVIENGDLDEVITVGEEINLIAEDSSKAGLVIGQKISVNDLMESLMLVSGNDSANTLAVYTARKINNEPNLDIEASLGKFQETMNQRAKELGAMDSHFTNPHGYHDSEHYSTAYDLGIITREAMKNRSFKELVQKPENGDWKNRNLLLNKNDAHYYPFATGVKTGYTSAAGQCLISSASKNDIDLIAVVLNSSKEGRWVVSKQLLEYGFKLLEESKEIQRKVS